MTVDQLDGYEWMVEEEIIQLQDECDVNARSADCHVEKVVHGEKPVHVE